MSYKLTSGSLKCDPSGKRIVNQKIFLHTRNTTWTKHLHSPSKRVHAKKATLTPVEIALESLNHAMTQLYDKIDHRDQNFERFDHVLEKIQHNFYKERLDLEKRFLRYGVTAIGLSSTLTLIAHTVTSLFPS